MTSSTAKIMTVREMIDAAIVFIEDDPIVDFKMLETILYIIGRKLYVLNRKIIVHRNDMNLAQSKKILKSKRRVKVTQLKIHRASVKDCKDTGIKTTSENASSLNKKRTANIFQSSISESTDKSGKEKPKLKEGSSSENSPRPPARLPDQVIKLQNVISEKLLVVSHSSMSDENQEDYSSPIVTQAQYNKMLSKIRELQFQFAVIPNTDSKSSDLHKPTSLTEPQAALNLASRLDAMYKELINMIGIITNLASGKPGIDLEGPYDNFKYFLESIKEMNTLTTSSTDTTESVAVHVDAYTDNKDQEVEEKIEENTEEKTEEEIDVENLATCSELNYNIDEILKDVIRSISKAADVATGTAKEAVTLFKKAGPKLPESKLLSLKLIKVENLVNRFAKKINAIDVEMATQMSDCQEAASNMQMDVTAMLERIDDYLAHPLEDRAAVAAISEDFADMQFNLDVAHDGQTALSELQKQMATNFERILNRMEIISQVKTTKADALEIMKNKVRVVDVNRLLSTEQFFAVVQYLQREIRTTNENIESGETNWQVIIEDHFSYLNEKCDHGAMITVNRSLRDYCASMGEKVNAMLDITGDYRVNIYKKKLYRDDNCVSCGTPAVTKVSDKHIKLTRLMINRQDVKLDMMAQDDDEITRKPCVPGQPIPHPLDPRALVCKRYCGASFSNAEGSLLSTPGLEVVDINLRNMTSMQNKTRLTCSPCNTSE